MIIRRHIIKTNIFQTNITLHVFVAEPPNQVFSLSPFLPNSSCSSQTKKQRSCQLALSNAHLRHRWCCIQNKTKEFYTATCHPRCQSKPLGTICACSSEARWFGDAANVSVCVKDSCSRAILRVYHIIGKRLIYERKRSGVAELCAAHKLWI